MASTSTVVRKYHANYLASNEYFAIALDHVPLLTDSGNYLWWKLHVSYALKAAGYWGHVDGSDSLLAIYPKISQPPAPTNNSSKEEIERYREWRRHDDRCISLLIRRMTHKVFRSLSIYGFESDITSRRIWKSIIQKFERDISRMH